MKLFLPFLICTFIELHSFGQANPIITGWLQNTSITGKYYISGNSTPVSNNILVNTQKVQYNATNVFINATGVPSYVTGPFFGNPSIATNQNAIFRFPLNPSPNTGTPTPTTGGNIGLFVNGVALFDYRDGVGWNSTSNSPCGGPGNPACGGTSYWNRDAVLAERGGFDCAKAHPAMGNYHHHQNPSAFKLDLKVLSTICNLYDSDGLYAIDSTKHSPLIGFAYDGYPIYGAYGYKNTNGTGGIVRIKSSFKLRNITNRTTWYDGTDVPDGPAISTTYPLGYYREDYEFVAPTDSDYLDIHNGRFCVTPDYPNGTYAYFATVDQYWNSTYPYVVGPTFYGVKVATKVTTIPNDVTVYVPPVYVDLDQDGFNTSVDCNDSNANINPGAVEIPNNTIDENCDGIALIIDVDMDGFNSSLDCNDSNANINPGATEIPNNTIDENCDGVILVIDVDNDGFNSSVDCNDTNGSINPGALEIPNNSIDENCDGTVLIIDVDNDGFNSSFDCDDANAGINPDALEIPNNGIDENCDGLDLILDVDNDGFNSNVDCDDNNASINPNAVEIANNTTDENCDGIVLIIDVDNDGFNSAIDCDDMDVTVNPSATEIPNNIIDENCDGVILIIDADNDGFNSSIDCDDMNATINPNVAEVPYNGVDDDCNVTTLDDDLDKDGYIKSEDCDDTNANINPLATEIPNNGIDEDCNGQDLLSSAFDLSQSTVSLMPNPASDFVVIQILGLLRASVSVEMFGFDGKLVHRIVIQPGSTVGYLDVRDVYDGEYIIKLTSGAQSISKKVSIVK